MFTFRLDPHLDLSDAVEADYGPAVVEFSNLFVVSFPKTVIDSWAEARFEHDV